MNRILKKFSLFHYNIGFFPFEEERLLQGNIEIQWMKHSYKDRFFADPFILSVSNTEIMVLVEDFEYGRWKGNISLLVVDRKDYSLKRKKTLLDLETHLSFPFITRQGSEIYVIPENSAAGRLTAWRYDEKEECLQNISVLTEMPVIDPVIYVSNDHYFLFGSLRCQQENAMLYQWESDNLLSDYRLLSERPVKEGKKATRRGGDFFSIKGQLYAAAQCCEHHYGEALNICMVNFLDKGILKEEIVYSLHPTERFPYGLHTLNIHDNMCVVDGLTFLFRPLEKMKVMIRNR